MRDKAKSDLDVAAKAPEQNRLRDEFRRNGLVYGPRSGRQPLDPDSGCGFAEAAIALACAHSASLAAQAKREASQLWRDVNSATYASIFNSEIDYADIWWAVRVRRTIEAELEYIGLEVNVHVRGYVDHGNLLISHIVFYILRDHSSVDFDRNFHSAVEEVANLTFSVLAVVREIGDREYYGLTRHVFRDFEKADRLTRLVIDKINGGGAHDFRDA